MKGTTASTQVDQPYVNKPCAGLDCISGAVGFLRKEWGEYGYHMSIEASGLYSALFGVRHSDGSEFYILSDRYGCAYQVEWDGREWVRIPSFVGSEG